MAYIVVGGALSREELPLLGHCPVLPKEEPMASRNGTDEC